MDYLKAVEPYCNITVLFLRLSGKKGLSIEKKQGTKWLRTDYFVKNGQLQMKGTFSSLSPETRDGYFEWFFENGKLKVHVLKHYAVATYQDSLQ